MKNKKIPIIIIMSILIFIMFFLILSNEKKDTSKQVNNYTSNKISNEVKKSIDLYPNLLDLGEYTESTWPKTNNGFEILLSNEKRNEDYSLPITEQQTELRILPNALDYEINFVSGELVNKEINIKYTRSKTKIPRLIGHEKVFSMKGIYIKTDLLESSIYKINLINEEGRTMYTQEINFTKPYYPIEWQTTRLTWGEENQLIFSSNKNGKWELWSYKVGKDEVPIELSRRTEDLPLNQLPTLGDFNINIPKPKYNKYTDRITYHSIYDIWEVKTNGYGNFPLTTNNPVSPNKNELLSFDVNPLPSNEGKEILYSKLYEPIKSELWIMNFKGNEKRKLELPENGFLENFIWSPNDDQIAVVLSSRESELTNGRTNLWILYPKENKKPRRITTVGYNINSLDFNKNNKTIALSMKIHETSQNTSIDIWTVNSNNTELKQITPKDGYGDFNPIWSPDGTQIAFISGKDGFNNLWVMDIDGNNRHCLNKDINTIDYPLWSKDGNYLYISDIEGSIYQFDLKNNKVNKIVEGSY